jgi:hypothetical protein
MCVCLIAIHIVALDGVLFWILWTEGMSMMYSRSPMHSQQRGCTDRADSLIPVCSAKGVQNVLDVLAACVVRLTHACLRNL